MDKSTKTSGSAALFAFINTSATAVVLAVSIEILEQFDFDVDEAWLTLMYSATLLPLFARSLMVHSDYCLASGPARLLGFLLNGAAIALIFPVALTMIYADIDFDDQSYAQLILLSTIGATWAAFLWAINEILGRLVYGPPQPGETCAECH